MSLPMLQLLFKKKTLTVTAAKIEIVVYEWLRFAKEKFLKKYCCGRSGGKHCCNVATFGSRRRLRLPVEKQRFQCARLRRERRRENVRHRRDTKRAGRRRENPRHRVFPCGEIRMRKVKTASKHDYARRTPMGLQGHGGSRLATGIRRCRLRCRYNGLVRRARMRAIYKRLGQKGKNFPRNLPKQRQI